VNSITSSRPFALSRALRSGLVAVVTGVLMAAGLAVTPAHAVDDVAHLTLSLTTKAGKAPSSTLNVYAEPVVNGAPTDANDTAYAERSHGEFELELTADQDYVLLFDDPALLTGYSDIPLPLYYGGTSKLEDATVVSYGAGNHRLDANIVSAAKVAGKVVGADKKALKSVEVNLFAFDGSTWQLATTALTSAKGTYSFSNVDAGDYKLSYQRPTDDAEWIENGYPDYVGSKFLPAFSGNATTLATASIVTVGQTGTVTQNATLKLGGSITGTLATSGCTCDGATVLGLTTVAYKLLGNPVTGFTGIDNTRGSYLDSQIFSSIPFGPGYVGKTVTASGKYTLSGLPEGYYVVQVIDEDFDFEDFGHPEQFVGGGINWRTGTKFVVKQGKAAKAPSMTLRWATELPRTDALFAIENDEGIPLSDVDVELAPVDGTFGMTATTDDNGNVELTRLVPGNYTLTIAESDYLPLELGVTVHALGLMQRVTLEDRVELEFTDGVSIDGDPIIGTTLAVNSEATLDGIIDVDHSYQWYRDGVPIFGARGETYTVRGVDLDATLSVRVWLDAPSYSTLTGSATVADPVAVGQAPTATSAPVLSYTGGVLRVNAGRWDVAAVTPSYTWLVDGTPISNAGTSLKTTAADAGKTVSVQVVASKFGYENSAPTLSNVVAIPKLSATIKKPAKVTSSTVGEDVTYTFVPPVMSQTGYSFAARWYINGIDEGTGNTITLSVDDDRSVYVKATGTHPKYSGYAQEFVVEKGAAPVAVDQPFITVGPDFDSVLHGTGIAAVGVELRADQSQWLYSTVDETPTTRSYQWLANGVPIKGATKSSFTPTVAQANSALSVAITVSNPRFDSATFTFAAGTVAADTTLYSNPATVTLTGSGVAGTTLTAKASAWPIKGVATTYEWYLCQAACLDDEAAPELISGATGATLTVAESAPLGSKIAVVIRGLKTGYQDGFAVSAPITVSEPELVTPATKVAPKLSKSGDTFSIASGSYSVTGGSTSVEWFADTTSVGTDATFTLSSDDAGKAVRAVVSYELAGYASAVTTLAVQQGPLPTTGTPAIGTRTFGGSLSIANPFTYSSGSDNLATLSYKWFAGGKVIKGATKSTLPTSVALLGKPISVTVVSKSPLFPTATFTSAPTTILLKAAPETAAPVTFTVAGGALKPGAKATVAPITWNVTGLKIAYHWQSSADGTIWSTISKATKPTYTATTADAGKQLRVRVSATRAGYDFAEISSAPRAVDYNTALEFTTDPVVTGSGAVGTSLSVSAGTSNTTGAKFSYQWLLDDIVIPGATKSSLAILPSHFGKELSVRVTASKPGNVPATVEPRSVKVGVGAAPVATSKNAPKITGTLTSGSTLIASTGIWNIDGLTFTFQWKRNGVDVADATSRSYELTAADVATQLSVTVTATRTGYANGTSTSTLTKAIR